MENSKGGSIMSTFWIVVICVVGGLLLIGGIAVVVMTRGMSEVKSLVIQHVDPAGLKDGEYLGRYAHARWIFAVVVTVQGGRITAVRVTEKDRFSGDELHGPLTTAVLEKQSPVIDVVSGATVHTRAFQKAVENALAGK
jgi:uncharacterized protein with FMN-binding domain